MNGKSPVAIRHIFCNDFYPLTVSEQEYYIVFWWKNIPLGDIYLSPEQQRVDDVYHLYFQAISPALNFYVKDDILLSASRTEFLKGNFAGFSDLISPYMEGYVKFKEKNAGVSVVICTRNRSENLRLCLKSFENQLTKPDEIIVIDNAPTDNSTRNIVQEFPGIIYYKEERPGLDIARNTGAQRAVCPIIAYTDDDVQLHPAWVQRIVETFRDENVHAMTGLILASSLETESQQLFEKFWSFNRGYVEKKYSTEFIKDRSHPPKVWRIGAGANMAFRKQTLIDVNYFDERLDVGAAGCNGDSEIWFRILSSGFTISYNPLAVVYHSHRSEMKKLRKQMFGYMRGHVTAALIQNDYDGAAGYKKHVYTTLRVYYFHLLRKGFPFYQSRYSTVISEARGIVSGIFFYRKNKNSPSVQTDKEI